MKVLAFLILTLTSSQALAAECFYSHIGDSQGMIRNEHGMYVDLWREHSIKKCIPPNGDGTGESAPDPIDVGFCAKYDVCITSESYKEGHVIIKKTLNCKEAHLITEMLSLPAISGQNVEINDVPINGSSEALIMKIRCQ